MSTSTRSILDTLAGSPLPVEVVRPEPKHEPATGHVMVVPYNACNDPEADKFLPWMWKRMQDDDLVDYYFPGQKDTGFATFVRLFSGDGQVAIFINKEASGNEWAKRIVGFITWTTMTFGSSECIVAGFIFFREWWDHSTTDECAREAFKFWFTKSLANIVLGVCPELHKTALRYNKRVGLHEIGRIPGGHLFKGQPCDALLMAMTRKEWEERGRTS